MAAWTSLVAIQITWLKPSCMHTLLCRGRDECDLETELKTEPHLPNERQETPKGLQDVGVGGSRLAYGGAQLGIAQSSKHGEDAPDGPHHQRHTERPGVDEDPL